MTAMYEAISRLYCCISQEQLVLDGACLHPCSAEQSCGTGRAQLQICTIFLYEHNKAGCVGLSARTIQAVIAIMHITGDRCGIEISI
jgi:hypothetical protein